MTCISMKARSLAVVQARRFPGDASRDLEFQKVKTARLHSIDWLQKLCQTEVSDVIRLSPVLMFFMGAASIVPSHRNSHPIHRHEDPFEPHSHRLSPSARPGSYRSHLLMLDAATSGLEHDPA